MPRTFTPFRLVLFTALAPCALADTTLTMRGGAAPPPGAVTGIDAQGVTLNLSGPAPVPGNKPKGQAGMGTVVSWDRIASVQGELASAAAPYLPAGEKLWRARTRLERGDIVGAEPLFEQLFPQFAGHRGATAAVVAGGLLRCRLATGAQTGAVAPWLAYLGAIGDADQPTLAGDSEPGAGPAIDPATGLAPSLPPIWVNLPSVQSLARTQWALGPAGSRAAALGAYYEQAARFEAGLPVQVPTVNVEHDDAVALVREMVLARIGDETQRSTARQLLSARLKRRLAPWSEVWIRTALGRSMLLESSREVQLLGIAELVQLPARFERINPYLTGIALAEGAAASAKLNDLVGASRLRDELSDRFPGHPALEWEPLRGWAGVPSPAPARVEQLPRESGAAPNPDPNKGGPP
jgi:hypothetical protein